MANQDMRLAVGRLLKHVMQHGIDVRILNNLIAIIHCSLQQKCNTQNRDMIKHVEPIYYARNLIANYRFLEEIFFPYRA
ncbi:predicted protein [Sclerotinia sclerotiorum 1980 UF-70]|uniref:Uncharacterized protein n=1 Tax=Sclerotinia sclerotiorum (strain ATCC 18683 / 1980 / Ss-1) TaxID=665079 RepID=A7ETA4_SCLS1|nr:predicted protein [Sclerotinia sclerotiorum 1980 UF-70]EDN92696.1 predicted protein [Sclerotinia sclerotiorum 1980 UF-70]